MIVKGGYTNYGQEVGILMLDTFFPRIPGDMGNATTWPFPVLYRVVKGASPERVVLNQAAGLLDEVRSLLAEPAGLSRTARQALGYKELIAHLEGECSLDEAVDTLILRTRQFAVRQERWFRRDPRVRWVHIEHDPVAEVLPVLIDAANAS